MKNENETMIFRIDELKKYKNEALDDIMLNVYKAFLDTDNNDPVKNIIEYFISGDPLYITRNKNARNDICRLDKYDLLRHIIKVYYENLLNNL